jgi:hypothetical protein
MENLDKIDEMGSFDLNGDAKEFTPDTFQVEHRETTMKSYKHSDLPVYTQWSAGYGKNPNSWTYRCRVREGKLIGELLKETAEGVEYQYSTVGSVFSLDNKRVTEDECNNKMHKFMNELKDKNNVK